MGQPLSVRIPTSIGYIRLGNLEVGDKLFGVKGQEILVTEIIDNESSEIYRVLFDDGRRALCCKEQLWDVKYDGHISQIISLGELMFGARYRHLPYHLHPSPVSVMKKHQFFQSEAKNEYSHAPIIVDIRYFHEEPSRSISVDVDDGLYLTEDLIVTHGSNYK